MTSPTLSRGKIADAALDLLEAGGPENLTMRRLSDRFGVTATALYHHFSGREALLDAVVERLCGPIVDDLRAEGDDWQDVLRRSLTNWMTRAALYPTATAWALASHAQAAPVLAIHEALIALLLDAGVSPGDALHVKGATMRYCVGHLTIRELGPLPGGPGGPGGPGAPAAMPRYRSIADAAAAFDRDRHFTIGLDALLDGLANSPHLDL